MLVKRFPRNTVGRDFIVGDIHGCFTKLSDHLDGIGFDATAGDRLFSVGDLVDRGPESDLVLKWLAFDWFHPIQGNHEDMAIRFPGGGMDAGNYRDNGGGWNVDNTPARQREIAEALAKLPVAIEVETELGLIGIVHADVPGGMTWQAFTAALEEAPPSTPSPFDRKAAIIDQAQWSRDRTERFFGADVEGVRAVVVGHTRMPKPTWITNVLHIDTGGWHPIGHGFTVVNAHTLEVA